MYGDGVEHHFALNEVEVRMKTEPVEVRRKAEGKFRFDLRDSNDTYIGMVYVKRPSEERPDGEIEIKIDPGDARSKHFFLSVRPSMIDMGDGHYSPSLVIEEPVTPVDR